MLSRKPKEKVFGEGLIRGSFADTVFLLLWEKNLPMRNREILAEVGGDDGRLSRTLSRLVRMGHVKKLKNGVYAYTENE